MTIAIENPIIDYLVACGGKDNVDFHNDDGSIDINGARQYADKLRNQNHDNVEIEQRNNRVIIKLVVKEEQEIWPSV